MRSTSPGVVSYVGIELPDVDLQDIRKRHLCGVSFVAVTARNERHRELHFANA